MSLWPSENDDAWDGLVKRVLVGAVFFFILILMLQSISFQVAIEVSLAVAISLLCFILFFVISSVREINGKLGEIERGIDELKPRT